MTWDHEINSKWPPVRVTGPKVTEAQALDYILRTDANLVSAEYACNDRAFCSELDAYIGNPFKDAMDARRWEWKEVHARALGHLRLDHFGSNWVASSYIGGPNGLVSPQGDVRIAKNFGKWPSVAQIEDDLTVLAKAFPWLACSVWLWDNPDEEIPWGSDPTHAWDVGAGAWARVATNGATKGKTMPEGLNVEAAALRIALMRSSDRETSWRMGDINRLFGLQIERARDAANNAMEVAAKAGG